MPEMLWNGPADSAAAIVLAHGAGAPMDSGFMNDVANGLAAQDLRVARFEFPYMASRRVGQRRGPDRPEVLRTTWLAAIAEARAAGAARVIVGGKSLGGRIASLVADEAAVDGLLCLGYPFHPPGKPEQLRTKHLAALRTTALIVQGERDPFGTREDVAGYALSPAITLAWLPDGDHSFKPRKSSGTTERANVERAIALAAAFAKRLFAS